MIKITRESEHSKWNEAETKLIFTTDDKNKRDVLQNCFILEDEKVLVVGNYLTLLDKDLNELKQIHISASNDRYFITTSVRLRYGYQDKIDSNDCADLFLINVWPDMRIDLKDTGPNEDVVP